MDLATAVRAFRALDGGYRPPGHPGGPGPCQAVAMATPDGLVTRDAAAGALDLGGGKLGVGDAGVGRVAAGPAGGRTRFRNAVQRHYIDPTHRPRLRVGFDPTLRIADLQSLLQVLNGQIVAGPSALGIYTIALDAKERPEAALDHALTVLRAHRQVLLAEPLQPSE